MRPIIIVPLCLAVLGSLCALTSAEQKTMTLCFDLYFIEGDISGTMSLTDDVWSGIGQDERGAKTRPLEFFTLADLTIGDVKLKAEESGWTWDGRPVPPEGKNVKTMKPPRALHGARGQPFVWETVTEADPVEYFERRTDGLFRLKRFRPDIRLLIAGTVDEGESGRVILRDLGLEWNTLVRRRPIEGVNLNAGPPIREKDEPMTTTVSIQPDRYYGILVPTVNPASLLVRLRVESAHPIEGAQE